MKTKVQKMKKCFAIWLIPVLLLPAMQLTAAEDNSAIEHQLMLEEAERARREAQVAREGAMKAAQMARETARMNAEITREAARREDARCRMRNWPGPARNSAARTANCAKRPGKSPAPTVRSRAQAMFT
jgi:hypothetical protein